MSIIDQGQSLREAIRLPDIEPLEAYEDTCGGSSSVYGATRLAASYCGFKRTPSLIRGQWQHGWIPSFREKYHPAALLGLNFPMKPEDYYYVARKDEEEYLRACGFRNAIAIGLPLVYLPRPEVSRRPGSLLIMPAHSIDYTTHTWKFDEYADCIAEIRSDFAEVVVCVHPSCLKRGYWVNEFRKRGFPVVTGAGLFDRNALTRIACLMSTFEYVTTNSFGSQLAYAAYFGAKPSIFGTYAAYSAEDFKHNPFTRLYPELIAPSVRALSESALRRECPQLFRYPKDAKADVEWGRFEIGASNRISPREMRSLFQWDAGSRLRRAVVAKAPGRLKHRVRMRFDPEYRETERLCTMPRYHPTTTELLGPRIEVNDGPGFIEKKRLLFDQEIYRFAAKCQSPKIIDCGASTGLTIAYFKRLYPDCGIVAFEPDPNLFEILRRNCDAWRFEGVQLVRKAVWTCETSLPFLLQHVHPGRLLGQDSGGDAIQVQTCRLRDFLSEEIDLLRLNVEGAETDVLVDCYDLLPNVHNVIVNYHSILGRPQRLDVLMGILTEAGFLMDFRANNPTSSPLLFRHLCGQVDSKLNIFAYRV
jgi:FkbM family methyltransferase